MTEPAPVTPPPAVVASAPGRTLGIVALIVSFFVSILGLILGIVAKVQSNRAGVKNTPATVAIVLSILFLVGTIILVVVLAGSAAALLAQCGDLGPGVHELDSGVTITCS